MTGFVGIALLPSMLWHATHTCFTIGSALAGSPFTAICAWAKVVTNAPASIAATTRRFMLAPWDLVGRKAAHCIAARRRSATLGRLEAACLFSASLDSSHPHTS